MQACTMGFFAHTVHHNVSRTCEHAACPYVAGCALAVCIMAEDDFPSNKCCACTEFRSCRATDAGLELPGTACGHDIHWHAQAHIHACAHTRTVVCTGVRQGLCLERASWPSLPGGARRGGKTAGSGSAASSCGGSPPTAGVCLRNNPFIIAMCMMFVMNTSRLVGCVKMRKCARAHAHMYAAVAAGSLPWSAAAGSAAAGCCCGPSRRICAGTCGNAG